MPAITMSDHGKGLLVKGDTQPIKEFLKLKGGSWNKNLVGWMFKGSARADLLESLRGHAMVTHLTDMTSAGQSGDGDGDAASTAAPAASAGAKKARPAEGDGGDGGTGGEDEEVFEIDSFLLVKVNTFAKKRGADIRKHFKDKSGEMCPTAKGVRLSAEEWQAFTSSFPNIDSVSDTGETPLKVGERDLRMQVNSKGFDLRRYYVDKNDQKEKPTKKGVNLNATQWAKVKELAPEITKSVSRPVGEGSAQPAKKKARVQADAAGSADGDHSGERLRKELKQLIKGRDLATLTPKLLRGELETKLGLPAGGLEGRKAEVKGIIEDILS
eukprot:TRINITY_DN74720_c0_g1_i1.p1 TRINITY_DN74720_c0_g1~~TRINITY_DN74720_c0_g1_i1.p1  ORF type:complete len:327 (-),score=96.71 TRINITY_DN74720_c0_g1_i1:44-1024(-)